MVKMGQLFLLIYLSLGEPWSLRFRLCAYACIRAQLIPFASHRMTFFNNEAVSPLRIRWRWFPIAIVTKTTFPILRSGTSATGFVAGFLPH